MTVREVPIGGRLKAWIFWLLSVTNTYLARQVIYLTLERAEHKGVRW